MTNCMSSRAEGRVKITETGKFRILSGDLQCDSCGYKTTLPTDIPRCNTLGSQRSMLTGEEIRSLRQTLGFDRENFADILDISEFYLARLENGTEQQSILFDMLIRAVYRLAQHGSIRGNFGQPTRSFNQSLIISKFDSSNSWGINVT